ncbi:hypothetical protein DPMN_150430 [Dreissena polymorpha]|uniref:Uncharacterized protein n=1 Tax=Dreissena polymorpha TaxID=45954 RepID=A0A9D4FDR5_DREPO|nr:hypothetical protein DPMN_150430 [Dreissena polymorpha]
METRRLNSVMKSKSASWHMSRRKASSSSKRLEGQGWTRRLPILVSNARLGIVGSGTTYMYLGYT